MKSNHLLVSGAYLVAGTVAVFALVDALLAVWPVNVGEAAWRYGAAGMLSRNLINLSVGVLLAIGVAVFAGHRLVLRSLSLMCGAVFAVLLVLAVLFGLDAIQLRRVVQPELRSAFDFSSAAALVKTIINAGIALLLALGSWRAARNGGLAAAGKGNGQSGLLAGSVR